MIQLYLVALAANGMLAATIGHRHRDTDMHSHRHSHRHRHIDRHRQTHADRHIYRDRDRQRQIDKADRGRGRQSLLDCLDVHVRSGYKPLINYTKFLFPAFPIHSVGPGA